MTRSTGRKTQDIEPSFAAPFSVGTRRDFLQDALAELGRISSEALQLLRTVRALGAEDL